MNHFSGHKKDEIIGKANGVSVKSVGRDEKKNAETLPILYLDENALLI